MTNFKIIIQNNIFPPNKWHWSVESANTKEVNRRQVVRVSKKSFDSAEEAIRDLSTNIHEILKDLDVADSYS